MFEPTGTCNNGDVVTLAGTVLVQQLMAVLIGQHDMLFPPEEDSPTALELVNNNNIEPARRQAPTAPSAITAQNAENNNTVRQCVWEAPDSPSHRQHDDNGGSPRSASPRNGVPGRFDVTCSPPLTVKKNPAFNKGSGIVTNGSFSSSPSSDHHQEKTQTGGGGLPVRRSGTLKGSGTKMGTSGVTSGGSTGSNGTGVVRMGVSGGDVVAGSLNGRSGLWVPNGCVTLRENNKTRDCAHGDQTSGQNRLSTYDNVHLNHHNLQQHNNPTPPTCLNSSCEDKQSVDSATWSTSSCEISLPDNSTSCRSSTTTCPEQDFYGGHYEDLDARGQDEEQSGGGGEGEGRSSSRDGDGDGAGRSSSDNSNGFTVANGSHSALHSLVAGLKQEMHKQKNEYESRIKRWDSFAVLMFKDAVFGKQHHSVLKLETAVRTSAYHNTESFTGKSKQGHSSPSSTPQSQLDSTRFGSVQALFHLCRF